MDYSAYAGVSDLPLGKNDVGLMGRALVQGLHVDPFHIWVKSSDGGFVTRASFLTGMKRFLRDTEPEDVLLFYFSGASPRFVRTGDTSRENGM